MRPKCNANISKLRGYKIRIYPTKDQEERIQEVINTYRGVYNLALEISIDNYNKTGKHTKFYDMCTIFKDLRNNNPDFDWLKSISIGIIRQALLDLENAYCMFFSKICNFPKFKSRKRSKKSFITRSDRCTILDDGYIGISGVGRIFASNHTIPKNKRLYNTQVSFNGYDKYWFSCQVEVDSDIDVSNIEYTDPVGIDVGVRNMITTSDGMFYKYSDISKLKKKLSRIHKRFSRYCNYYLSEGKRTRTKYDDVPKSKNFKKLKKSIKGIYEKISNKRSNDINCATKSIVNRYPSAIVIEDLSVKSMQKDEWFNSHATEGYFYEIRRQLEYKATIRGIEVIVAKPDFPSTKMCSNCGFIKNLHGNKIYKCPVCGLRMDRDLNASINLRNLAYQK